VVRPRLIGCGATGRLPGTLPPPGRQAVAVPVAGSIGKRTGAFLPSWLLHSSSRLPFLPPASGGYGNTSEYIRELIRQDRKKKAEEKLEKLLIEGLDSGEPVEITPEYWERKRRELVARVEAMKKQKKRA
jgi:antitoxin ParD1/3/4